MYGTLYLKLNHANPQPDLRVALSHPVTKQQWSDINAVLRNGALMPQLIATLIQARIALEYATPKAGQYVEPMKRHIDARCAIDTALEAVGMKRFNVYNATSETDIGFYYGATAADALDMLGQSKGCKDYATFSAQHGLSPLYNNLQITEVK